jgi:hypothetical protein
LDYRIRVFISSKQDEFETERTVLAHEIKSIPILEPVFAEAWLPQGSSIQEVYLRDVRSCPIYVGLFGCVYSEPTRLEYVAASENPYRERLIYLKECAHVDPLLQDLIETFERQVVFRRFRTVGDLLPAFSNHVLAALSRMITNYQLLGEPKPVAHGSGSVLERRWASRRRKLLELGLPGNLTALDNEHWRGLIANTLKERGYLPPESS